MASVRYEDDEYNNDMMMVMMADDDGDDDDGDDDDGDDDGGGGQGIHQRTGRGDHGLDVNRGTGQEEDTAFAKRKIE